MTKQKLYLFVGYPGAGKTTVAKRIAEKTGAIHIWADHERQKMFVNPTHSTIESRQLYTLLDAKTETLLNQGQSVIFDTNFNYRSDRELLKAIAARHHAETIVIWMTTPKATAKQRALHHTHRERNGYITTMSEDEFENLSNHIETPSDEEKPIKIDGTTIDLLYIDQLLGL